MSENTMVTSKKRRSYDAIYTAHYRKNHPEKAFQWRVNAAVSLLEKLGYTLIEPDGIEANTENGGEVSC